MTTKQTKDISVRAAPETSLVKDCGDFIACTLTVYGMYISYGVLHERIYTTPRGTELETFSFSLFLVWAQSIMHMVVAGVANLISNPGPNKVPQKDFAMVGLSYIGAMFASSAALEYVSYPTQVLAKSCKLIPVMLMRIVIAGARYSWREYLAIGTITAGIGLFLMYKKAKASDRQNSGFGLSLLGLSLFLDGLTGPKQDQIRKTYEPAANQFMFWMNLYPVIFVAPVLLYTGEMWTALTFLSSYPDSLLELSVFIHSTYI